jgi:hypothetical protein
MDPSPKNRKKSLQVNFRLDEETFMDFKRKLLDDGNLKIQEFCERMVKSYIEGKR